MMKTHKNNRIRFMKSKRKKNRNKNNQKTKRSIHNRYNSNSNTKKHDYTNFNFKKLRCSPKEKNQFNNFTCYTNESLYKLRDQWNSKHSDKLIKTNDPKEIHSILTSYLSNVCKTESCWLKQNKDFGKISKDIIDSFAPVSPDEWKKNPNEWLSSVDIDNVMNQYKKAYKCFEFIGPSPIDFDLKKSYGECVWNELCNFSIDNQIKKGKNKIGIIFNTDPHNKSGAHWISLFINIKKGLIFFFDSVGTRPSKEIINLVNRIIDQGHKLNPKINFKFEDNKGVEHQHKNTECGIYSLFFIIHMLQDKTNENFYKTHIIKDDQIQNYRKIYFNEEL
jgi:hypothetical protein